MRQSIATDRHRRDTGSLQQIHADHREVVHLVAVPPPRGGGTCTCIVCGLVFQSKAVTWINNRRQHQDESYRGNYRSCRPHTA